MGALTGRGMMWHQCFLPSRQLVHPQLDAAMAANQSGKTVPRTRPSQHRSRRRRHSLPMTLRAFAAAQGKSARTAAARRRRAARFHGAGAGGRSGRARCIEGALPLRPC
eukprot:scaffold211916_cov31-Tisochrysis_lutea.AAC.6